MKKQTIFKTIFGVLFTFTLAFSNQPVVNAEESTSQALKITDMVGREVVLEEGPATEIISLMPADAEILFEIGAGDTLVGRGTYVDYPEEDVQDIPVVATGEDLNVEELVALDPQLVIMTTMALSEDQLKSIEEAGIPVFVTDAKTIDQVYEAIELLGQIVGHEKEADELIEDMSQTFEEYTQKAKEEELDASVYYEITPLEYGLWTAGNETFMDEMGQMLGLENVFADQKGFVEVSEEKVIELNPSIILTTAEHYDTEAPTPEEEIMGRKGWQDIDAVKNDQVFAVDNSAFTRPGPRLMEAIKTLYEYVYDR
ncbi:ABC transporter substrate-binding protein [Facklamia sp. DSM 111018]|uniref:ABC transporter substrate-binding protein n=1 Tax=Facklamia lactis TaxID=2749967 RepID=A0ABS0LP95_9LACT|nr:ABC transporter substrate-binding protein [Facklamia lactis]MBG9980111.1 ABC transporter substrate-binding protein [Facklamia lactis]MBG9985913.1 ABC transporter substrate-binding protein [Facklamia lactis]